MAETEPTEVDPLAYVPYEEIEDMFDALPSRSWQGLHDYLLSWRQKPAAISRDSAMLAERSMDLSRAGEPFPLDPQDLADIINGWLEAKAA